MLSYQPRSIDRTLVIAHYGWDFSWWVERLIHPDVKVFVYNKSGKDCGHSRAKIIPLPNMGLEGHSYLTHIVNNYETMTGQLVFIQDHPHLHYYQFFEVLDALPADTRWFDFGLPYDLRKTLPFAENYWKQLFQEPCPPKTTCGIGTQFLTTAEGLRTKPKSFYRRLLKASVNAPRFGEDTLLTFFSYFLEGFTSYLFSGYNYEELSLLHREWRKHACSGSFDFHQRLGNLKVI